ncbi:MAG: enoyl-CoA hydratase/isomerase family protein [Promethearchaeota archaeon]
MGSKVVYSTSNKIGKITLSDGEHGNPIDLKVLKELIAALEKSIENQDIVLLYTAEGKNFTVGANLKAGYEMVKGDSPSSDNIVELFMSWQEFTSTLLKVPAITIVGYHGWLVGGGFEHTLLCDFKIAAEDTTIMLPELGLGLFFSNASTKLLPMMIGINKTKELMMLGSKINAKQAEDLGLVYKVCAREDLEAEMEKLANRLLKQDPSVLMQAKQFINQGIDSSIDQVLYMEGLMMIQTGKSPETKKRIEDFINKHH